MRAWASRLLVVSAAFASIATSRKKWELEATRPANMPTEAGSAGLLATIEASGTPEVTCTLGNGQMPRIVPPEANDATPTTYLCPPGSKLGLVTITGPVRGCGDVKPPSDQYVRIVKTELVPVWSASVEEVFDISSDESFGFTVESPRVAFVDVVLEGTGDRTGLTVNSYAANFHRIELEGGFGSERRFATVRVHATVVGRCSGLCAKPANETLKIVKGR
jgi:hypothetical protein